MSPKDRDLVLMLATIVVFWVIVVLACNVAGWFV